MFFITEGLVLVKIKNKIKKKTHDILNNFFLDFLIIKKSFKKKVLLGIWENSTLCMALKGV